jgi:hypothetical protein
MPTNFPTSLDNFTNPTANDSLNLPSHSTQHANANDAIEAIEAKLGVGNADKVGMYCIYSNTFTSAATLSVNSVFTSAYTNYKIVVSQAAFTATSTTTLNLRMRANGVDNAGGNYAYQYNGAYGTTTSFASGVTTAANKFALGAGNGTTHNWASNIELLNPVASGQSIGFYDLWTFQSDITSWVSRRGSLLYGIGGSDGFSLFADTGNISATIRVYGYRDSNS